MGIVGQRTARRQADTIARSGFRLPQGYTIKGNYPMDEISDTNIGDLWKTVQQKYVISDLKGLSIDEKTGLPSQLAERKERLTSVGHEDALTEAKFELEEAEGRRRARERSEGSATKKKVTKKAQIKKAATAKTPAKQEEEAPIDIPLEEVKGVGPKTKITLQEKGITTLTDLAKLSINDLISYGIRKNTAKKIIDNAVALASTQVKPKEKSKVKAKVKPKVKAKVKPKVKAPIMFLEIDSIDKLIISGNLTIDTDEPIQKTIMLSPNDLTADVWEKVAMTLQSGDIVQLTLTQKSDGEYATTLEK